MADWKASLSALDRYEAIRSIQSGLGGPAAAAEAVAMEQEAYRASAGRASLRRDQLRGTRDEYQAACRAGSASSAAHEARRPDAAGRSPDRSDYPAQRQREGRQSELELGVRIGPYRSCVPISGGATSDVYRAGDRALKVIVDRAVEPHNPQREARILRLLRPPCIPLLDVFRDQEQRLVLAFPLMPLTLASLLDSRRSLSARQVRSVFADVLRALEAVHALGIVHRDVKPSAVLLRSPDGPAFLSDFGTAWHPELSAHSEPAADKVLDIGTGPYRAPEVLFGNRAYGPPVDMWALGAMLAEAVRSPPAPLFESRPVDEDGNQLGLILSIFKTLGTPTPESWPEARAFKVSPFELWTVFPPRPWAEILADADASWTNAVAALVRYDGKRASASTALGFPCFANVGDEQ